MIQQTTENLIIETSRSFASNTSVNLLLSLGISKELLNSAGFDETDHAILNQRLRAPMSSFKNSLKINQLAQLLLLTGRVELITPELTASILSLVDNWGAVASHYAAWSGNRVMIEWVKKKWPELMNARSNYGKTIAHYAAWSGNTAMFEWVISEAPELLDVEDNSGRTVAHYGAWSGNKEMLELIKNQSLNLLKKENDGRTIAHYAAWSGSREMFEWLKSLMPNLFEVADNFGASIAHYAAWSGNTEMIEWVKNQALNSLKGKDKEGRNIGHYGVWSGNLEMLMWVYEQTRNLLGAKDNTGRTIVYYAARSKNKELLEWIKNQIPYLFKIKNNIDQNVAHYAAISGDTEMLEWVKKQMPSLLETREKHGLTIAHRAAIMGHKEVIEWIKNHVTHLLKAQDDDGQTIAHYAAASKDASLFNWCLSLCETPEYFEIHPELTGRNLKTVSQTLLSSLFTNFTLIEVKLPPQVDNQTQAAIAQKLSENNAIKTILPKLKQIIMGYYQEENPFSTLPAEILFELFQKIFPAHIPKIRLVFDSLMTNLSPAYIHEESILQLHIRKNNIVRLIDAELERLNLSKKPKYFGLIEESQTKMEAWTQIKEVLSENYNSLNEMKKRFLTVYRATYDILHHRRNNIHSFFNPTHMTKTQRMLEKIATILNVHSQELASLATITNCNL